MKWLFRILLGLVLAIGSLAMALKGDWVKLGLIWAGFAIFLAARKNLKRPMR